MVSSFGLRVDWNLNVMRHNQSLTRLTERALAGLSRLMARLKPDMAVLQGDTTTALAGALAAFYLKIPVAHVEAGLRSFDLEHPYPEEFNRIVIDRLSALHFAPTKGAKKNLMKEGIDPKTIHVTGNTAIDALESLKTRLLVFHNPALRQLAESRQGPALRWILLTAHRRENFGKPLKEIFRAAKRIVQEHPQVCIIFPVHLNPEVRREAGVILKGVPRVLLTPPLIYSDLIETMRRSYCILTDSGGIQEEAPALGKPVFVLRKVTERPEGIHAGTARLIGELTADRIFHAASRLLRDPGLYRRMARIIKPYGDGQAAPRILAAVKRFFG